MRSTRATAPPSGPASRPRSIAPTRRVCFLPTPTASFGPASSRGSSRRRKRNGRTRSSASGPGAQTPRCGRSTRGCGPGRALCSSALGPLPVVAVVASVVAYLVYASGHTLLGSGETMARLFVARRLVDASAPGRPRLGGVCLPLPQLLATPTIWLDSWYHSGLSASVVSMAAYVLAIRYLYKTGLGLTGMPFAGVAAAVVFGANPDVLYLQSTPMSVTMLAACAAAAASPPLRWTPIAAFRPPP